MTRIRSKDHHGSHKHLLWPQDGLTATQTPGRAPHAIIVPTVRPPAHLVHAAELAAQLGCPLVTLHSGKWTSAKDAARRLHKKADLLAIDISDPASLQLPDFETSNILPSKLIRRADTSAKRNLALILSHILGWRRIVFLDDDIFVDDVDYLKTAVGLLSTYNAVGLSIGGFPDNSVVCHAYRAVGGDQQSFIGGGALAVQVSRDHSFFPNIYNEDWFYLLDAKEGLRRPAVTGAVVQTPYDPYRTPERARAEEFGDVLAEGVFWLLDQNRSIAEANKLHWEEFLGRRARFIEQVLSMTRKKENLDPGDRIRMIAALRAARSRLLEYITPELCEDYLGALANDQELWRRHIERRRKGRPLEAALRVLTKPGCPPLRWEMRNHFGSLPYRGVTASSNKDAVNSGRRREASRTDVADRHIESLRLNTRDGSLVGPGVAGPD